MRKKTIWDVAEMKEAEQQEMLAGDSAVVSLDLVRTLKKLPGVAIFAIGFHKYYL